MSSNRAPSNTSNEGGAVESGDLDSEEGGVVRAPKTGAAATLDLAFKTGSRFHRDA